MGSASTGANLPALVECQQAAACSLLCQQSLTRQSSPLDRHAALIARRGASRSRKSHEARRRSRSMEAHQGPDGNEIQPGRRWVVNALLGTGVLASIATFRYPALRYIIPPAVSESTSRTVVAAKTGELKNNSAKVFRFGSEPAILIRTVSGDYVALSAVCTHLGCTVQYRSDLHEIWCPCHNGMYDLNGRNVSGPPPKPLAKYDVHVQGEDIVVTRSA
jgi:cytochrome b6-f complex iron-sulfur subunit